jgi:hypothetical protein
VRDEAITAGFQLFKSKGLVPVNADSDSDDVNYAEAAGAICVGFLLKRVI